MRSRHANHEGILKYVLGLGIVISLTTVYYGLLRSYPRQWIFVQQGIVGHGQRLLRRMRAAALAKHRPTSGRALMPRPLRSYFLVMLAVFALDLRDPYSTQGSGGTHEMFEGVYSWRISGLGWARLGVYVAALTLMGCAYWMMRCTARRKRLLKSTPKARDQIANASALLSSHHKELGRARS